MCGNNLYIVYYKLWLQFTSKKSTLLFNFCTPHHQKHLVPKNPLPLENETSDQDVKQLVISCVYIEEVIEEASRTLCGCLNQVFVVQVYTWIELSLTNRAKWTTCNHKGQTSSS